MLLEMLFMKISYISDFCKWNREYRSFFLHSEPENEQKQAEKKDQQKQKKSAVQKKLCGKLENNRIGFGRKKPEIVVKKQMMKIYKQFLPVHKDKRNEKNRQKDDSQSRKEERRKELLFQTKKNPE